MRTRTMAIVMLAGLSAAAGIGLMMVNLNGLSTRAEPTVAERLLTRAVRRWSVPGRMRGVANPVKVSPDVLAEARAHFADHCASCHANDGGGGTALGRNMFPRAPDMRLAATQELSDGELYWIIEHGIRLTGMPAWGTGGDDDEDTWKLVHLIRRLNHLTPDELQGMEALNPKSPADLAEEQQDRDFLAGRDQPAPEPPAHHQHKEQQP